MDFSIAAFVVALRASRLLEPEQLDELDRGLRAPGAGPEALAQELMRRDWLTPYQVKQLLDGRGRELVLEPYLILGSLGRGGMGQVFKARHRTMNRVVALKVIRQHCRDDPRLVQRFRREIQAVARLSHPNIVMAFDADEVDGTLFLVMEYVEGVDLAELVGDVGPLTAAQASDYVRQACLGLQHAHEQGLVHRDIKPSNLLLASKDSVVKILDLGLARLEPWDRRVEAEGPLTQTGVPLGTVDYLAPEQALDPARADIRADLYSLGCTFYHLLAGQPPFPQGNPFQKWWSHKEAEPRAVESLHPGLPPGLAQVVRKLMAKSPDDRYRTPKDVAAALEPFCSGIGARSAEDRCSASSTIFPARLALAEEPATAPDYIARGKAHFNRGEHARAIADFDAAVRLDPKNVKAYFNRGYTYRKMGAYSRAIADFDAAIRLDPGLAKAYYNRGNAHHARGDYARAIADFGEAIRLDPNNAQAYNNRGYAHASRREYDRAVADYGEAIRLDPGLARAYSDRGFAHHARGEYDRAIADYGEVLRLDPAKVEAYSNRGYAYHAKGEHDRAIADYDAAIRLDPNNACAYLNRGNAHRVRGEFDRAIADFDEVIRLDPGLAKAYYNRGNAHRARGEFDRAIADFGEVIRLEPAGARAYNNRGDAHAAKGEYDRAVADLGEAIRLDPGLGRAYYNRGKVFHVRGEYDRAIADYDAAIRLDPGHARAFDNRGQAHASRGADDRALADFDAAIRLDPGFAKAYVHRAELHDRRGERQLAEADRRAALTLDPKGRA
jgi:tetratricopeptide (TPR) repeat protein/tRNA A-37 threonylcarbamoyl transferase component Bud32